MDNFKNIDNTLFNFIEENKDSDCGILLLKYHGLEFPFDINFAIDQIICRKKTKRKLSDYVNNRYFLFPDILAAEQSSNQLVSRYHAAVVGTSMSVLDMTSGLGIDAMEIARNGNNVIACDIVPGRTLALQYNASLLGIDHLTAVNQDSTSFEFLTKLKLFDVIFIDPARRDNNERRTYSFRDCTPDILSLLPNLKKKGKRILIKASPLLDITQIRKEIEDISDIHVVCVRGECKEVFIDITKSVPFQGIKIVDIADSDSLTEFRIPECELYLNDIPIAVESDLKPGCFIYEPNAGLMKINCNGALLNRFNRLKRMAKDTALYVSDMLYEEFPGRVTEIVSMADKKLLKSLKGEGYNVVSRNYPQKAEDLRKKYAIKEGYDKFLYAFRVSEKRIPVICLTNRVNINKDSR